MERQKLSADFYEQKKEVYLKQYWGRKHSNIYIPNGVFDREGFIRKNAFIVHLFHKGGRVIDLGCGNGLLLRFIVDTVPYALVPYGVDFLEPSIRQAREVVLPEFKNNFSVGNVRDYVFKTGFDFIITNPVYVADEDLEGYFHACCMGLKKKGVLIFCIANDVLMRLKDRKRALSFLNSCPMHWTRASSLFGYAPRERLEAARTV